MKNFKQKFINTAYSKFGIKANGSIDFEQAFAIIDEIEQCNIANVSKRFSIGQKVMWGDLDYWVMEDNGEEKVLIANSEKVSDPDYNDWWVRRTVLNAC